MRATFQYPPTFPFDPPPLLVESYQNAIHEALHKHGPAAFEATREAAMTHEAGHAIVGAHEGFNIRSISIFPRGALWEGRCDEGVKLWASGPDTTAEDDLRRARFTIAGLVGEVLSRTDRPGSSLDELVLSQLFAINIAAKLAPPSISEDDYQLYVPRLWQERVWNVVRNIILTNHEPFNRLANLLNEKEHVRGPKLRKVLAQVKKVTP
jgi:hypothetical protein